MLNRFILQALLYAGLTLGALPLKAGDEINPGKFTYPEASAPAQIPICMIGDSITWAGNGDYWRKYMIERIPSLAFIGTHTAVLGYSHAGEGGNSTEAVLKRMKDIPDCPYYSAPITTASKTRQTFRNAPNIPQGKFRK